jgi:amidohydrolase
MTDPMRSAALALTDETIALRRDFHQYPELAFNEVRTSGIVADTLEGLGLSVRTDLGKTGVVAVLRGNRPGRTVLARADMDALPIHEERDVPYRSRNDGVMHACGHDGHTAVLLSVAKLLSAQREILAGTVVFVFQPAEEIVSGAEAMLKDGALDGLRPDATIGLHLSSDYPTGTVALRAGPAMAATDAFAITVAGKGGHAAQPHRTVDPVLISAQLIVALQQLISRETDPADQAVLSITAISGGSAHNIIPETVSLKGTLRTFKAETRSYLQARLSEAARGLTASLRGQAELSWHSGSPAVVNDPAMAARFRALAAEVVGAAQVVEHPPIMGGDDMALWLAAAPGCYFFVGARNEAAGIDKPHHHPQFDLDEAALPLAVELLSRGILDFLR